MLLKVPPPDDDDLGPESEDNDDELQSAFSSVTIPPIIKTVVRNGRTLVYRIQDSGMEASKATSQSVGHCDTTTVPY